MAQTRLREILRQKGLTMRKFAEMVGCTPQYISGICSGELSVSLKQLTRFAELLGVSLNEILTVDRDSVICYCPHCGKPIRLVSAEIPAEGYEEEVSE